MARKIKKNRIVLLAEFTDGGVNGRLDYILTSDDSVDRDLDVNKSHAFTLTQGQKNQLTVIKNQVMADVADLENAEIEE